MEEKARLIFEARERDRRLKASKGPDRRKGPAWPIFKARERDRCLKPEKRPDRRKEPSRSSGRERERRLKPSTKGLDRFGDANDLWVVLHLDHDNCALT